MRATVVGLSLLLCWATLAHSQQQATGLEVPDPKTLGVGIAGVDEHARAIGLTIDQLRDVVDATLWRSGIEKGGVAPDPLFLGVRIHVVSDAFVVSVEFHRWVGYRVQDKTYKTSAVVWRRERTGTHGHKPETIVAAVAALVDEFTQEYLSANRDRL